jgi:hypothetical protein
MSGIAILKPFIGFIRSSVLGQLRGISYTASGFLVGHGWLTQDQYTAAAGVVFFVGAALFQLIDNFVVDGKFTFAINQPAPPVPVKSVTVALAAAQQGNN